MGGKKLHELKQYLRQRRKLCLWEGVRYCHSNQARWECNELQLVVLQEYTLEAMYGAHNDVDHLGLKWMLDILWDHFYWPNLEDDATHHIQTCKRCLKFKSRQDKEEVYPLLPTYPLELVHIDFLTVENPNTGVSVNILVITDHFTQYAKAIITSKQTAETQPSPSGTTSSQILVFWKVIDRPRLKLLSPSSSRNCSNWPVSERCEQHHITQRWMANGRDLIGPLLVWFVHWKPKINSAGKIIFPH